MTWISVKDRLPPSDDPVWIYWRDREVLIGWYTLYGEERERAIKDGLQHEQWWSQEDQKCRWTHYWMPLTKPEPPVTNDPT